MGNILITASHFQTLCQDAIRLLEDNGHHVILNDHDMPYFRRCVRTPSGFWRTTDIM